MDNIDLEMSLKTQREMEALKIMKISDLTEAEKKKLPKNAADIPGRYSDALTSADEKFTTASEEEEDISKENLKKLEEDPKKLQELLNQKPDREAEAPEESITAKILDSVTTQDVTNMEKQFETEFHNAEEKERFLYGLSQDAEAIEIAKFLRDNPIKSFVPESEIEDAVNFKKPRIRYNSVEDMEDADNLDPETDYHQLDSTAIVEIQKKALDELDSREGLSRKDRSKIKDLKKLLTRIGEFRVQEPRLLMKIFEVYSPKTTLD